MGNYSIFRRESCFRAGRHLAIIEMCCMMELSLRMRGAFVVFSGALLADKDVTSWFNDFHNRHCLMLIKRTEIRSRRSPTIGSAAVSPSYTSQCLAQRRTPCLANPGPLLPADQTWLHVTAIRQLKKGANSASKLKTHIIRLS